MISHSGIIVVSMVALNLEASQPCWIFSRRSGIEHAVLA